MQSMRSQSGAASVIALSIAAISFLALAGLLKVRLDWRLRVREQFRLDRCVEKTALNLEKIQNRIQESNFRMWAEKAAALAAAIPTAGASIRAVRPILEFERAWQEMQLFNWRLEQAKWIAKRGCDRKSDLILPLPNLKWERPPPDSMGPMPLRWNGKSNDRLSIRLWKSPNFSGAQVYAEKWKWKADWASLL